jgi:hypothetical protein
MKQCWIVGEAQIAPEPDQGSLVGFHAASASRAEAAIALQ